MNYRQAKIRADILKAMANPVRVLLVHSLIKGDRSAGELNKAARINPSNISRHLGVLKKAGIVSDRRVGMRVLYHLETPCILKAFDCAAEVVHADSKRRNDYLKVV